MRIARGSILLVVAALLFPFAIHAQTNSIAQEINALLAEIAALQKEVATYSPTSPIPSNTVPTPIIPVGSNSPATFCPSLARDLSQGARGDDVMQLQTFLDQEGFFYGTPTGFFGPATEASVQEWQSAKGIMRVGTPSTTGFGAVGPKTRIAIANRCTNSSAAPITNASGCLMMVPPIAACTTGWQAVTDSHGCTTAYQCVTPPPPTSQQCPGYQTSACTNGILVSNGVDAQGCNLGYRCSTLTNTCSTAVSSAQSAAIGQSCAQVATTLRCPSDNSYTYGSPNSCQSNYLTSHGWTGNTTSSCATEFSDATIYAQSLNCISISRVLTCSHDPSYKTAASNTCVESYLKNHGWYQ